MRIPLLTTLLLPTLASAVPWDSAAADSKLATSVRSDGRSRVVIAATNHGNTPVSIDIPAGLIAKGKSAAGVALLRGATLEVPAGKTVEAEIPAVPLSFKNGAEDEPCTVRQDAPPALKPLLEFSAKQNDLPRTTAQLAALLLLEDVTFPQWQEFLRKQPSPEPRPTPADVAAAVDAIAIARQLAPERKFAILEDADFRLRAVRNPWSRGKAMQVFGIAAPEGVPVPDLNQLLHTRPGDNCPICRMRSQSAEPANGL